MSNNSTVRIFPLRFFPFLSLKDPAGSLLPFQPLFGIGNRVARPSPRPWLASVRLYSGGVVTNVTRVLEV